MDIGVSAGVITGILAVCEVIKILLKRLGEKVWAAIQPFYFLLPVLIALVLGVILNPERPLEAAFTWVGAAWSAYHLAKAVPKPTSPSSGNSPPAPGL